MKLRTLSKTRKRSQAGTSLLEVMIAGIVLISGMMLGVLPMITYGIVTMHATDEETIAKQKARQIMESIYGARDTSQLGWDYINPTTVPTTNGTTTVYGVFLTGPQPMYSSGSDGILGTADDAAAGLDTVTLPNSQTRTLSDFTRTITIGQYTMPDGSISTTLRTLQVDVTYPFGNGQKRTFTIQSLISQYK